VSTASNASFLESGPEEFEKMDQARRDATDAYVKKVLQKGITAPNTRNTVFSAHQMGTAQMSATPETGVCKDTGEVWEIEDLYVADTSLFPTPSGANPMITAYAVTYDCARRLCRKLKTADGTSRL